MYVKHMPVSVSLNTPQNRMAVYPTDVYLASDVNVCPVSFYEKDGMYWFCIEYSVRMNSCSFFNLRNCVSSLKDTAKALGFNVRYPDALRKFVDDWAKSLKRGK